ncbi:bifunctional DNA primase/polymerase [Thalassotalea piscium]
MNRLAHAKIFAAMGFLVFRIKKNSKTPAFIGWQKEATTDVKTLTEWFENDEYNVGLITGKASGFNVIDVDIKDGKDGRVSLQKRFGDISDKAKNKALSFKTATGGYHIPVKWTPETDVSIGSKVLGLENIDIRGNGGYIVAPSSSRILDGKTKYYEANDLLLPLLTPSGWVKELLVQFKSRRSERHLFDPTEVMTGVESGNRNTALFTYACHLRSRGFDQGMISGFILQAAKLCIPPFPIDEAQQVIASAFEYPAPKINEAKKKLTLKELI